MVHRRFHLVATTSDVTHTFAISTAAGWQLPWIDDANCDVPVLLEIDAHLKSFADTGEIVHTALLWPELTDDVIQCYCCAVATGGRRSTGVKLVPHTLLASTPWLASIQRQAWLTAIARLRNPVADFDCGAQVGAAMDWVSQQLEAEAGARLLSTHPHRCMRYDYVVRCETSAGTTYFKGGPERVADEAPLTERLRAVSPHQFPETVALDPLTHRWLYRELRGVPLANRLTIGTAASAAHALAVIQQRTLNVPAIEARLAEKRMRAVELLQRADVIVRHAWRSPSATNDQETFETWNTLRDAMLTECAAIDALDLPMCLVPSDFTVGNILITSDGIGFIDVGKSYWTYPQLALERFVDQVERRLQTAGIARACCEQGFADAWAHIVSPAVMLRALGRVQLLDRIFWIIRASHKVDLQERSLGAEAPLWYRASRLSPFAQRCLDMWRSHEGAKDGDAPVRKAVTQR